MKIIKKLLPPENWRFPVAVLLGIFAGLSAYLVKISNATSYLSDEPTTCINCHVMKTQYATWFHSSHREVANCERLCMWPHTTTFANTSQATDGLRHRNYFFTPINPRFSQKRGKKGWFTEKICQKGSGARVFPRGFPLLVPGEKPGVGRGTFLGGPPNGPREKNLSPPRGTQ